MKKLFEQLEKYEDTIRATLLVLTTLAGLVGAWGGFTGNPQGVFLVGMAAIVFCVLGIVDEAAERQNQSDQATVLAIIFLGTLGLTFIASSASGLATVVGLPTTRRSQPLLK